MIWIGISLGAIGFLLCLMIFAWIDGDPGIYTQAQYQAYRAMQEQERMLKMCPIETTAARYKRRVEEELRKGRELSPEVIAALDKWLAEGTPSPFKIGAQVYYMGRQDSAGTVKGWNGTEVSVYFTRSGCQSWYPPSMLTLAADEPLKVGDWVQSGGQIRHIDGDLAYVRRFTQTLQGQDDGYALPLKHLRRA